MVIFSKTLTKNITIWNLKHGICNEKDYKNDNVLYNVEKVLKKAIQ